MLNSKNRKMIIYISTPITGIDQDTINMRITSAVNAIKKRGHTPVSPLDLFQDENLTYGQYIGKDIEVLIDQCDAVLFTPGYRTSRGCMIELYVAGVTDKKTYYDPEQIPQN